MARGSGEPPQKMAKLDTAQPTNVIIQFQSDVGETVGMIQWNHCSHFGAQGIAKDLNMHVERVMCLQTGPQLDVPHDVTPKQLETLLNGLLKQEEKLPYSFFVNEQQISEELGTHLLKNKVQPGLDSQNWPSCFSDCAECKHLIHYCQEMLTM